MNVIDIVSLGVSEICFVMDWLTVSEMDLLTETVWLTDFDMDSLIDVVTDMVGATDWLTDWLTDMSAEIL